MKTKRSLHDHGIPDGAYLINIFHLYSMMPVMEDGALREKRLYKT
jgi:hypothetical protein